MGDLPLQRDAAATALPWSVQMLLALLLVAVFGLGYLLRRRSNGSGVPRLLANWLGRQSDQEPLLTRRAVQLAPGVSLHVVQWDAEEFLLSCTARGVSVISRRMRAQPMAAAPNA